MSCLNAYIGIMQSGPARLRPDLPSFQVKSKQAQGGSSTG